MEAQFELPDLKGIVRRRKKSFIIPFILIFMITAGVALILPPIYRSHSMIIIEGQQIPEEYVKTTITSFVEERLQVIRQKIMTRTKLLGIINQFDLYSKIREKRTTEEILVKMRKDIQLKTISASVVNRRTGKPSPATIAFTLSYEGKYPSTVQKVANVLASFFLEEDMRRREELATATTDFLEQESENLKEQIHVFENKISIFKKAHIGELPEYNNVNLQAIARLEREFDRINSQISTLGEKRIYLKGQIISVDPLKPIMTEHGKVARNPKERLRGLHLRLISLQSMLSEKHPDVKKLKNEIKELEAQVGKSDDSVVKIRRLSDLEGQLAVLKGKLGPKHPDVIKLSREVRVLSSEVDGLLTERAKTEVSEEKPDNPAYINLMTRIAALELESEGLLRLSQDVKKKVEEYEKRLERTPVVEKEYNELTRDYESAKRKHSEIVSKLLTARIAQGMEQTQRGERFIITEPAQLPEKPYKPNRIVIVLIGFVLALGAGVGLAAVREAIDSSVKTTDQLSSLTSVPVFSAISMMESDEERRARQIKNVLLTLGVIGVIVVALVLVNQFVMPLDILWAKIQRRLAMMELQF